MFKKMFQMYSYFPLQKSKIKSIKVPFLKTLDIDIFLTSIFWILISFFALFFILTYFIYQFVYQISQPQNNDLIYISTQHNLPNTSNKFILMFLKIISTLQLATPKMSIYRLS